MSKPRLFLYEPDGKVLSSYFWGNAPVEIIQGPIGPVSGDTEFLSLDGWHRIDEWAQHPIAEWSPVDCSLKMVQPGYIVGDCSAMWHFHNEHSLSMVVSDDHRVPLYSRTGEFKVRRAGDIAKAVGRWRVPTTYEPWGDGVGYTDDEIRLRVAIAADGCLPKNGNQIVITVRKSRKKERLVGLLDRAGVDWHSYEHSTRPGEVTFAFPRDGWSKGFDQMWWRASSRQLRVVLDECLHWDGLADHAEQRFYTTVRSAADFIQYAAHACGRRASITERAPLKEGWSPDFVVQITKPGSTKAQVGLRVDNTRVDRVPAPGGKQYCFATGSGFFLARHNGRIFITGNSGTSTASIMRLWRHANEQQPGPDRVRRTSWLIVRNTYSELERTTIKTWSMWFEERVGGQYGELARTRPPHHRIKTPHPSGDGTMIDAEFIFLALDVEEDVRRLMSIEPTGVFFNEAQFIPKEVFDEAQSRAALGRYPPKLDGGPTWCGVIADLNAPSEGHWIPYMRGDVALPSEWDEDTRREYEKPDDWKFHIQPPGLLEVVENGRVIGYKENPEAENKKWLNRSYAEVIKGKSKAWIDARVMNRVGLYKAGKPVFESFRPEIHITEKELEFVPEFPIIVGMDFARNPAAIFGQVIRGVLYVLSELGMENVAAKTFAPIVKQHLATNYPNAKIEFWGDPTGASKGQSTDHTPFQIFSQNGMMVFPAPGNNRLPIRLETIETLLTGMVGGVPKLQISPTCRMLKTAMNGGYHFRKIQGQNRHHEEPHKDRYADYADALQYLALGAGFGTETIAQPNSEANKPRKSRRSREGGFSLKRRPRVGRKRFA